MVVSGADLACSWHSQCHMAQTTVGELTFSTALVLLLTGIHQPQQDQIPSIKESMDFLTTRSYGNEI